MDDTYQKGLELRLFKAELRIAKLEAAIMALSLAAARLSGIEMGYEADVSGAAQKAFDDAIAAAEHVKGKADAQD